MDNVRNRGVVQAESDIDVDWSIPLGGRNLKMERILKTWTAELQGRLVLLEVENYRFDAPHDSVSRGACRNFLNLRISPQFREMNTKVLSPSADISKF